jgi:hypothetical protein
MVVNVKSNTLYNVTPYTLDDMFRSFGDTCCLHHLDRSSRFLRNIHTQLYRFLKTVYVRGCIVHHSKIATGSMIRFLLPGKVRLLLRPTIFRLALGQTSPNQQRLIMYFSSKTVGTKSPSVTALICFVEL